MKVSRRRDEASSDSKRFKLFPVNNIPTEFSKILKRHVVIEQLYKISACILAGLC